jgi:predicted nuclease with TOPRIM domain
MDLSILKTILPLAFACIAGLIALVRLQSRSAENSKQLDMLTKDVSRLEKESTTTVTLVAKMEQAERNYSELWSKYDKMDKDLNDKMERHRDRLDDRFNDLRDRINGAK